MAKEQHPFLELYPLRQKLKYLVLGTIPPNKNCVNRKFEVEYFYGNQWSFWLLLQPLYPNYDFKNLGSIRRWETDFKIGFSDTVRQCQRLDICSALDKDLNLDSSDYNHNLKRYIFDNLDSLQKIYLTSSSGKFNTLNNLQIIMGDSFELINEKLCILQSPSGTSNLSLYKGKPEFFGLLESFYNFLRDNYPEAIIYAEQTWERKTQSIGLKISRLPADQKYSEKYKKWHYAQVFPQLHNR